MDLKILTFNIWDIPFWFCVNRKRRMARLGAFLKEKNTDVLCLQENFDVLHRRLMHKTLGETIYNLHNNHHKTRRVFLYKKFDKTGGLATYSKFPIVNTEFVPFKKPLLMSLPEKLGSKGFLKTLIKTPKGNIMVVNVHFLHGLAGTARSLRNMQIKQLIENLRSVKNTVILAGDFNDEANSHIDNFSHEFRGAGFSDAALFLKKIPQPTLLTSNKYTSILFQYRGNKSERYDHIFIRNCKRVILKVLDLETLLQPEDPLSDHEPVMAKLRLVKI